MNRLITTLSGMAVLLGYWGVWAWPAGPARFVSAAEPGAQPSSKAIHLTRCEIYLIDEAVLASDRPGIIAFVEPEEGDRVEAGQKLAALRDEVAKAQLAVAELEAENDVELRYAVKAAEVAEAELEVAQEANRRVPKAVPEVEIKRLRLAWQRSELQIDRAEIDRNIAEKRREEAEAQLKTHYIEAPFDGVVTRVRKHKGEAVRQGDPIVELKSSDRVRVEGEVDIEDVWRVRRGDPVQVRLEIPDAVLEVEEQTFEGKVVFVGLTANSVTHKVRVWAEVANPDNILRAGLPAVMTILPGDPVAADAPASSEP